MLLHTLDGGFPQAAKVRGPFWDESPHNILARTEVSHDSLCLLLLEEFVQLLEVVRSTNKSWSLHIRDSLLRHATNRLRQAMNALVVRSDTSSR